MPLGVLLKVRKNDESLRASVLIAVNYPHDMLKGATIKNLLQPLVGLPLYSKLNPKSLL